MNKNIKKNIVTRKNVRVDLGLSDENERYYMIEFLLCDDLSIPKFPQAKFNPKFGSGLFRVIYDIEKRKYYYWDSHMISNPYLNYIGKYETRDKYYKVSENYYCIVSRKTPDIVPVSENDSQREEKYFKIFLYDLPIESIFSKEIVNLMGEENLLKLAEKAIIDSML